MSSPSDVTLDMTRRVLVPRTKVVWMLNSELNLYF